MEENKTFTECRNEEIYHAGILGMKWGVRRYQNKDGSLTAAGKKRYGTKANFEKVQAAKKAAERYNSKAAKARRKANARTAEEIAEYRKKMGLKVESKSDADNKPKKNTIKDMSDAELASAISRARLEDEYNRLRPQKVSSGKKFLKEKLMPKLADATAEVTSEFVKKKAKDWLGLNEKKSEDALSKIKKEYEILDYKKKIKDLNKDTSDDDKANRLKKEHEILDYEKKIKDLKKDVPDDNIEDLLEKYGNMSEEERKRYKNASDVRAWEKNILGKKNKGGDN